MAQPLRLAVLRGLLVALPPNTVLTFYLHERSTYVDWPVSTEWRTTSRYHPPYASGDPALSPQRCYTRNYHGEDRAITTSLALHEEYK